MYEFSFASFFFGILIVIAGACFAVFHKPIADNVGSGVSDYSRYKLAGLITAGVGFLVMTNLHTAILRFIFKAVFPSL